jgi:cytochrome P450
MTAGSAPSTIRDIADVELPTYTEGDPTDYEGCQEAFAGALRKGPIALGPWGYEVMGYDLVRLALRDSRLVVPKNPALVVDGISSGPIWDRVSKLLISLEGANHQRQRKVVAPVFTRSAAERMRARCAEVIAELLERPLAKGHCEAVTEISSPYPVAGLCALFGMPRSDWSWVIELMDDLAGAVTLGVAAKQDSILKAWIEFEHHVERMLDEKQRSLGDDVVSDLLRAEADGERLTREELVALFIQLFIAGVDTTRNQLAVGLSLLAKNPDQWALLGSRPELAPDAVEEILRHSAIVPRVLRRATVDVELGGLRIPAGTLLFVNIGAANRDPAVYENPARFDISRRGAPAVMSFGGGLHYCLGVHLARIELTEALRVITASMKNPRITGPTPWKPIYGLTGIVSLPLEFTPSPQALSQ